MPTRDHRAPWEQVPRLTHLGRSEKEQTFRKRRRLREVRYKLFRLQTCLAAGQASSRAGEVPDGMVGHFLGQVPKYMVNEKGGRSPVPAHLQKPVAEVGGLSSFAGWWDIDEDLVVYVRLQSIWNEWDEKLRRITPTLGG